MDFTSVINMFICLHELGKNHGESLGKLCDGNNQFLKSVCPKKLKKFNVGEGANSIPPNFLRTLSLRAAKFYVRNISFSTLFFSGNLSEFSSSLVFRVRRLERDQRALIALGDVRPRQPFVATG